MNTQPLNAFCAAYGQYVAGYILDFAWWFLLGAAIFAVCAAILSIVEKVVLLRKVEKASAEQVRDLTGLDAGLLQALGTLIEALVKAPAWFGMFLAGVLLFWLAGDSYVEACKPAASTVKSTVTKTTDRVIEKTVTKGR